MRAGKNREGLRINMGLLQIPPLCSEIYPHFVWIIILSQQAGEDFSLTRLSSAGMIFLLVYH